METWRGFNAISFFLLFLFFGFDEVLVISLASVHCDDVPFRLESKKEVWNPNRPCRNQGEEHGSNICKVKLTPVMYCIYITAVNVSFKSKIPKQICKLVMWLRCKICLINDKNKLLWTCGPLFFITIILYSISQKCIIIHRTLSALSSL